MPRAVAIPRWKPVSYQLLMLDNAFATFGCFLLFRLRFANVAREPVLSIVGESKIDFYHKKLVRLLRIRTHIFTVHSILTNWHEAACQMPIWEIFCFARALGPHFRQLWCMPVHRQLTTNESHSTWIIFRVGRCHPNSFLGSVDRQWCVPYSAQNFRMVEMPRLHHRWNPSAVGSAQWHTLKLVCIWNTSNIAVQLKEKHNAVHNLQSWLGRIILILFLFYSNARRQAEESNQFAWPWTRLVKTKPRNKNKFFCSRHASCSLLANDTYQMQNR